jgi:hypothetical protein
MHFIRRHRRISNNLFLRTRVIPGNNRVDCHLCFAAPFDPLGVRVPHIRTPAPFNVHATRRGYEWVQQPPGIMNVIH